MLVQEMLLRKIEQEEVDAKRFGINVRRLCFSLVCNRHGYLLGKLLDFEGKRSIYCSGVFWMTVNVQ